MVQTTLSRNGYKIKKNELTQKELKDIKKDLTVRDPMLLEILGMDKRNVFIIYGIP